MDNKNNYYSTNNTQQTYQQPNYQQSTYQQPIYQQPTYRTNNAGNMGSANGYSQDVPVNTTSDSSDSVSVLAWIGYFLLIGLTSPIPIVGLATIIMVAFIPGKESRRNYGKALLIMRIVSIVLIAVVVIVSIFLGANLIEYLERMSRYGYYYY